MTPIEPLRKAKVRYRGRGMRRPDPRVDIALLGALVLGLFVLRRQLGRLVTERTGTWVGTIR